MTYDVHIGFHPPSRWDEVDPEDVRAYRFLGGRGLRPGITTEQIPWESLGLTPRWLGEDTSNAIAAIEPSLLHDRGAKEWSRFLAGARRRSETVLAVSMVGHPKHGSIVSFGPALTGIDENVSLPGAGPGFDSVGGSRTPLAAAPGPAPDLGHADRDLAFRLINARDPSLHWWALTRRGSTAFPSDGGPGRQAQQVGSLVPLLMSGAGEVVAAVWISPDTQIRHYIIPWSPSWEMVFDWLANKAIPEFVPSAVRRIHANLAEDPALQTESEVKTRSALTELDERYQIRRQALERDLARMRSAADDLRSDLLYGRDAVLEAAVAKVLADSGCTVTSLDLHLGRTASADLLIHHEGRKRLVEVKSASGNISERMVSLARNHLDTWPELRLNLVVEGISLVVNHQINTYPTDRTGAAYSRVEFVQSLTMPVVTTMALFNAWRIRDFERVRADLFGDAVAHRNSGPEETPVPGAAASAIASGPWWRRRRKS